MNDSRQEEMVGAAISEEPSTFSVTRDVDALLRSDADRARIEVELLGRAHRLQSKLGKALVKQMKVGSRIERVMSKQRRILPREFLKKHPNVCKLMGAEIIACHVSRGLSRIAYSHLTCWKKYTVAMRRMEYVKRRKRHAARKMVLAFVRMGSRRLVGRLRQWQMQAERKRKILRKKRRKRATQTLQRVGRGMLGRLEYKRRKREFCARVLQSAYRSYAARKIYLAARRIQTFVRLFIKRRVCATLIQSVWRQYLARCAYLHIIGAATRIQSARRGQLCRIAYLITLKHVRAIQVVVRAHVHRRFDALQLLQRWWRGEVGREIARARRRLLAMIKIQAAVRCVLACAFLLRHRDAAITMQATWRMFAKRNAYVKFLRAQRRARKASRIFYRVISIEGSMFIVTCFDKGLGFDEGNPSREGMLFNEGVLEFQVYSPQSQQVTTFYLSLGEMLMLTKVRGTRSDDPVKISKYDHKAKADLKAQHAANAGSILLSYLRLQAAKKEKEPSEAVLSMRTPEALCEITKRFFHVKKSIGAPCDLEISRSPVGGGRGRMVRRMAKPSLNGKRYVFSVYMSIASFQCTAYDSRSSLVMRTDATAREMRTFLHCIYPDRVVEDMMDARPESRQKLAAWIEERLVVTRVFQGYTCKEQVGYDVRERHAKRKIWRAWKTSKTVRAQRAVIRRIYRKQYDAYSKTFYYVNQQTGASSWNKPLGLGTEDLEDPPTDRWEEIVDEYGHTYFYNAGTGQTSNVNDESAAAVIQRFYRQRIDTSCRMTSIGDMVRALKFVRRIVDAYEHSPNKVINMVNFALYQFCIAENGSMARSVISRALGAFRYSPITLYTCAVFRLCDENCPRKAALSDVREWLVDARRMDKDRKKYILATNAFFKMAIIMKPRSWTAHHHFAVVLQWILGDTVRAKKHFRRAVELLGDAAVPESLLKNFDAAHRDKL